MLSLDDYAKLMGYCYVSRTGWVKGGGPKRMSGPNEFLDCSDYPGPEDMLNKVATKRAIGWMRKFRARAATDIIGFCGPIGGDCSVPIEHKIAEAIRNDTVEAIANHVWEMPLFDFVADKDVAAEHEPEYARLRFALAEIEKKAYHSDALDAPAQTLRDIKTIASLALLGRDLVPPMQGD